MKPTFYKEKEKVSKQKSIRNNTNSHVSNSIKDDDIDNGQIISGYFLNEKSYQELIIARVNSILYGILICLVLFCFVCYYFVSCKEVQLNQISRSTLDLNFENDELQNKVDSLQSYYNIDKAVSRANILERAEKVVEVNAIDLPKVNFTNANDKKKQSVVVGY